MRASPSDKGGEPGVWPAGGSIPFVLIFCFCIKTKEIGHSGYERYHEIINDR